MVHSGFGAPSSMPDVPVFIVNTMNEGDGTVIDQTDMVEWEVAGASHNDAHIMARGQAELAMELGVSIQCAAPLNDFPAYWVYNAALDWLNEWAREGERPPKGAPFQIGMRDAYGNLAGGVRIQDIEVPVATYTTEHGPADIFDIIGYLACGLGGSTVPFTPERLLQLYPTHDDYVQKYTQAADEARAMACGVWRSRSGMGGRAVMAKPPRWGSACARNSRCSERAPSRACPLTQRRSCLSVSP